MILQVKDVVSGYGEMDILHQISLEVKSGEIVSIVGPNGSGKSTTLKTIFGLLTPKEGDIIYNKESISGARPEELVELGLSFVPQSDNVFPNLTVHENLEMGAFTAKECMKHRYELVYDIFPPLKEKSKEKAGNLSGGQRQMVAFGRALIIEPNLLLLDEPTAGLAPLYINLILDKVEEINRETEISVLMVEQNATKALEMSDRGYVLAAGKNKYEDTGQGLLENEEVAELFLGG